MPMLVVGVIAIESDREYTFNRKGGRTISPTIHLPEFTYESRKVR
jgi:hypothetical protein